MALWGRMLRSAHAVTSALEPGCNIGLNLLALKRLAPAPDLMGYEINEKAAAEACRRVGCPISCGSILENLDCGTFDLAFTAGVLIHIDPDCLEAVYRNLHAHSNRYVLVAEYYNPKPLAIDYRGNSERLFKRDFAGDLIDSYGMKLVDCGFVCKRDNWAPQDDITRFLLEK